jgi:hypothetical protein
MITLAFNCASVIVVTSIAGACLGCSVESSQGGWWARDALHVIFADLAAVGASTLLIDAIIGEADHAVAKISGDVHHSVNDRGARITGPGRCAFVARVMAFYDCITTILSHMAWFATE